MSINKENFDLDLTRFNKAETIVINESKTPLAHVHAGAMRRMFLHYQLQNIMLGQGYIVRFMIGNDDYDPYDYFPDHFTEQEREYYRPFLGHPLCDVPSPEGKGSYADYFFNEMIDCLWRNFGITVQTYKTSELYRQGFLNDGIRLVLRNLNKLNEIYESQTGVKDKFNQRPLQIICPACGNMRTTKMLAAKEEYIEVVCTDETLRGSILPGCGFSGRVSPYGGNARLSWKLEWPVRWYYLKIGVEGSRKDQNSSLGSREFAELAFKALFAKEPPLNLRYDFCYIRSNHSVKINRFGTSAKEALKFIPPPLFFDMLTRPRHFQPINIDLESEKMISIYSAYVRQRWGDRNGDLFKTLVNDARYNLGLPLTSEQKSLVECLKHYFSVSQTEDAWFLDLKPKKLNSAELNLFSCLVEGLIDLGDWNATKLQYLFGLVVVRANLSLQDACRLMYLSLIRRSSGPRMGVFLEMIGRDRLFKYMKDCLAVSS